MSEHAIDKAVIPTCNILGVQIAAVNMQWTLDYIKGHIKALSGHYICVSNVHTTVMSYEDEHYRHIQNNGIMALPDGGPLSTVAKRRGHQQTGRVAGPSLMEEIFKISEAEGYRHYFYGSTEETLVKMVGQLQENYPGIQIVGYESPPFRAITEEEDAQSIQKIDAVQPDFVWIGLGAPKQERWMIDHQNKLTGLMIGVGAGFDYFAENIKRAPIWMQKTNLEWMYRLIQEPRRLFKRYLVTNTKFLWLVLSEMRA